MMFISIIITSLIQINTIYKPMNVDVVAYKICQHESRFAKNRDTVIGDSKFKQNYSVGYCQIRLKTAEWLVKRVFKPKSIIELKKWVIYKLFINLGTKKSLTIRYINFTIAKYYLSWLNKLHGGDWNKTIISYNTGYHAKRSVRNNAGKKYLYKVMAGL